MPIDHAGGIILISGLSVLAYLGGHRAAKFSAARPVAFAISLLVALLYAWTLSGKLAWASVFPAGSVFLWSNLMPVLLSVSAGLASGSLSLRSWRQFATVGALLTLALAYLFTPMMRPLIAPIRLASQCQWQGDLCLQSHSSSCAPAAAATLLRLYGVVSDERSMARDCLTSRHGTEPLGLYSGLAIAARRFSLRPRVGSAKAERWIDEGQLPCIALVRFDESSDSETLRNLLGPRGDGHAVVVLARDVHDQGWIIADPAFGETTWKDHDFRERFTGDAIYLSSR